MTVDPKYRDAGMIDCIAGNGVFVEARSTSGTRAAAVAAYRQRFEYKFETCLLPGALGYLGL